VPKSGLDSCITVCKVSVTFSPLTGRIYAAVSSGATTHISNANGDTLPVRTIAPVTWVAR